MADPIKIKTYDEYGIKIENIKEGIPINIFPKDGIPVAFKIDQDFVSYKKKIKVEYMNKDASIATKEVIPNLKFSKLFNSMKKHMFSTDSVVYCFYKDGEVYCYDCYSNTNYFPYCDIIRISEEFKYNEDGLNVLKPILSGYKKPEEVIKFFEEYLKEHPDKKIGDFFIMPAFPAFSATTYSFKDAPLPAASFDFKDSELQEIIEALELEELETVTVEEPPKGNVIIPGNQKFLVKGSSLITTGKEVEATLSFVLGYIQTMGYTLSKAETSLLESVSYMFTVWTNKVNMSATFAELKTGYSDIYVCSRNLRNSPYKTMAKALFNVFALKEPEIIKELSEEEAKVYNVEYLEKYFHDEIDFYLDAFQANYSTYFGGNWMRSDLPSRKRISQKY